MLENQELHINEKKWLEILLDIEFSNKNNIINQVNHSSIIREYNKYFISIHFIVNRNISPLDNDIKGPFEMILYKRTEVPVQFLLHIKDGYINELEVFNADSSEIDSIINVDNYESIERNWSN